MFVETERYVVIVDSMLHVTTKWQKDVLAILLCGQVFKTNSICLPIVSRHREYEYKRMY